MLDMNIIILVSNILKIDMVLANRSLFALSCVHIGV